MRPGSKLQVRVWGLSQQLGKLTDDHWNWAKDNLLTYPGAVLKSGKCSCLKCGHEWQQDGQSWQTVVGTDKCPSCGVKLKMMQTKKKKFDEFVYMHVVTTVEGFQVIRLAKINAMYKAGEPARINAYEVSQIWMHPSSGKYEIVGYNRHGGYGYYGHYWNGEWTLRHRSHLRSHDMASDGVYPKIKVLPEFKRGGFKNTFYGISPYTFLTKMNDGGNFETLLKAKQGCWLRALVRNERYVSMYWNTIKLCIRNKYKVNDVYIYFDYLDLLRGFGKDLMSPKYVCPKDFHKEHDILVRRRQRIDRENRRQRELEAQKRRIIKLEEDKKSYLINRSEFIGFELSKDNMRIKFMDSVGEVKLAGEVLEHCIFTNGYYNKSDSILFSCYVAEVLVETAEFSIKNMDVVQCRGLKNNDSGHHDAILDMFKENTRAIAKLIKQQSAVDKQRDINQQSKAA